MERFPADEANTRSSRRWRSKCLFKLAIDLNGGLAVAADSETRIQLPLVKHGNIAVVIFVFKKERER